MDGPPPVAIPPSAAHGRLCIVLAALLWSTSGAFAKVLTRDTFLELNTPAVEPLQIACLRVLFAVSVLLPTLRRSGLAYAGVMISLRVLRGCSSRWLIVLNLLGSGLVLVPFIWRQSLPSPGQLVVLFVYGAGQMAVPYWLVARGLRSVSPQEAGTI